MSPPTCVNATNTSSILLSRRIRIVVVATTLAIVAPTLPNVQHAPRVTIESMILVPSCVSAWMPSPIRAQPEYVSLAPISVLRALMPLPAPHAMR